MDYHYLHKLSIHQQKNKTAQLLIKFIFFQIMLFTSNK